MDNNEGSQKTEQAKIILETVRLFINWMEKHQRLATVLILTLCSSLLMLVGAVAVAIVKSAKSGALGDLIHSLALWIT